jgi:adenosine deaminase
MAKENGLLTVVHAGEEGPSEYVWEALTLLKASRIDHGNRSLDDDKLIGELVRTGTPLTLCPLSNLKLHVVNTLESHPLKVLMEKGVVVTVNSDDPAYFGGYINENYLEISRALSLTKDEIVLLAKNSVMSSFESQENKIRMVEKIDMFNHENFVT